MEDYAFALNGDESPGLQFPFNGWGDVPDPHDRRWPEGEDQPERADEPHPMLTPTWPASPRPRANYRELRGAAS